MAYIELYVVRVFSLVILPAAGFFLGIQFFFKENLACNIVKKNQTLSQVLDATRQFSVLVV